MIVLVCGGRDYGINQWEIEHLAIALDKLNAEYHFTSVIQGGARGADTLAKIWANRRDIPGKTFEVTKEDWKTMGKAAGSIRNQAMLDQGHPDLVVAFPGGNGTADMVRRARKAGIKVIEAP